MSKKNFASTLGASVKAQDAAAMERFGEADSFLSNLPKKSSNPTISAEASQAKAQVTRRSFSMTDSDYAMVNSLRIAAAREGIITTASEVIRAAIHAVAGYDGPAIVVAIQKLPRLRAGAEI